MSSEQAAEKTGTEISIREFTEEEMDEYFEKCQELFEDLVSQVAPEKPA